MVSVRHIVVVLLLALAAAVMLSVAPAHADEAGDSDEEIIAAPEQVYDGAQQQMAEILNSIVTRQRVLSLQVTS
jgi:hypothetical protein